MPRNSNFRRPRSHRLFWKNGSYGYGAKSRWGPPRVHLGANGVPLGRKKMGQNRKNYHAPIRIFDYPAVIDFSQKLGVTVMAPNHGGHPLGSILGYAVINFSEKMEVTVMARNHGGDPLGSILGPMGSHWVKKMGQNRRKLQCPKIRIFDYPVVIDFSQKMEVTVIAPNHSGDTLGSILGPMGSHWVQRKGENCKKLQCRKIRTFDYPAVIDFWQKIIMEVTVMAPNHGGDPLGSILGPMGKGSKP